MVENLTLYASEESQKQSCVGCRYWWEKYERCCHSKATHISTEENNVCDLWEERAE